MLTPMLIDTGASYTCVSSAYAAHLPMSDKFVKTVGFSGKTQVTPMTGPVTIIMANKTAKLPILVSDQTPVNLLGRDALCKLKVNILCSPQGVFIDEIGINYQMPQQAQLAKVYWLGNINEQVNNVVSPWKPFFHMQIPKARKPISDYHCTMFYDPSCSEIFEEKWDKLTKNKTVELVTNYIIIGQQGAAIGVETNPFISDWYNVPESTPHITLLVNEGFEPKDLGPMIKTAKQQTWLKTDNPLMFTTKDESMLKILCGTSLIAKPRVITVPTKKTVKQMIQVQENHLKDEMLKQVPDHVWSKYETDVGLVKSANPVQIELKPNVRMPFCPQYPLKPEAEEGISHTIRGLLEAGVLTEVHSPCNTPILPLLKADKSKYRLVHDLRAVNEVVQDWPADVPNPHTLLTNIPPRAKFFTVIDLCSAFFSIPLAEESQYLFAFIYRKKKFSYTRLPQGFKHSPHVFNQILRRDLEGLRISSTLLQYVDDLLICSDTIEECHKDSMTLLKRLSEGGHKVSQAKMQYCQTQVECLGRLIPHGAIAVTPSQLEGVSKAPRPQTVGQMMTFLGMTGFNSEWIEDYAIKTAPLRELMKSTGTQALSTPLQWTREATIAFETIKQEMQTAPALAMPNY
uniref:ribonuclease H n=1 Tax=Oryzias melastigma TaxID=30732 RepID=A0A3B3BQX6_ORYME